jgi:4-hydroxyphenylpyruvate dioxygenase-like putative hemolysin
VAQNEKLHRIGALLSNSQSFHSTHVDALQFGDVALPCYMRPDDQPLASSRGHLYDHIALSVSDLDGWVAKLRAEGVRFLRSPTASATRAR